MAGRLSPHFSSIVISRMIGTWDEPGGRQGPLSARAAGMQIMINVAWVAGAYDTHVSQVIGR